MSYSGIKKGAGSCETDSSKAGDGEQLGGRAGVLGGLGPPRHREQSWRGSPISGRSRPVPEDSIPGRKGVAIPPATADDAGGTRALVGAGGACRDPTKAARGPAGDGGSAERRGRGCSAWGA